MDGEDSQLGWWIQSSSVGKAGPVEGGGGLEVSEEMEELDCGSDNDRELHEAQIPSKKQRTQKISTCDAVKTARSRVNQLTDRELLSATAQSPKPQPLIDGVNTVEHEAAGKMKAGAAMAYFGKSLTITPPSKCTRTTNPKPKSTASHHSLASHAKTKYMNADLPAGCQGGNIWHHKFIPALKHFCGDSKEPWNVEMTDLMGALQAIWDTTYGDLIPHTVIIGGPVYQLVNQRLNECHGGFSIVALTVITTNFSHDTDFHDTKQCMEFAAAMVKKN
ncbi:hypothetical protein BDN67DRAFT_1015161 [Paxillus ammoniavirescens]|nr:hypothetical protein BDN67DRAFT_1015161 [Paxillus ammoniavirescens]